MGRHRKPKKLVVHCARIAVGGLALAEITGGLPAIQAEASQPVVVPAVYSTVQPVMTRHHHSRKHHAKAPVRAAKPAAAAVAVQTAAAVVAPVVQQAALDATDLVAEPAMASLDYQQLFDHYTVRPGDTLTHIAAAYGIPYEVLWSFNTDTVPHPDAIYPGQILRLPA